jgi:hypothetical protein
MVRAGLIFTLIMVVFMATSVFMHSAIMAYVGMSPEPLLKGFYVMNASLGLAIGVLIIYLTEKNPEITGFTFMGGSLAKFAVFFVVFYPLLSPEEDLRKGQFMAFFIPYSIGMVIEVWYLIRFLNKQP